MNDTNTSGQRRARVGGEVGVNGEAYAGGTFLPSTEKPKGTPRPARPRKVQVAPYVWVVDDRRPLFCLVGAQASYDHAAGRMFPTPTCFYADGSPMGGYGQRREVVAAACDRFNAGERFF